MKKIYKIILIALASLVVVIAVGFGVLYHNGLSGMSNLTEPKEDQIRVACIEYIQFEALHRGELRD